MASVVVETIFSAGGARPFDYLTGAFFLCALLVAVRASQRGAAFHLFALFLDALYFLGLAAYGADRSLWLATAFYLFVLLEAVILSGPWETLLVAAVSTVFMVIGWHGSQEILRTVATAGALALAAAYEVRRMALQAQDLVSEAERQRELAASAREQERARIAGDFHDGPLQSSIGFQIRLDIVRRLLERDREAGLVELQQLQDLSKSQVRELRSFIRSMRPLDMEGASLMASLRRLVDDFQKESGIPVTYVGEGKPVSIAPDAATEVVQMVREALHNVQKHAKATRVAVAVERIDKILQISIDDNGLGLPFSGAYTLEELELLRLGPVSIKRRARSLGADLVVESRPARGASVVLKIPL